MNQREQANVLDNFKKDVYNVLVATCVAEEGLDIGDVDLIICFDAHASPTRLVQRMGRTGRRRIGKCVMLLTEGVAFLTPLFENDLLTTFPGEEESAYRRGLKTQDKVSGAMQAVDSYAFSLCSFSFSFPSLTRIAGLLFISTRIALPFLLHLKNHPQILRFCFLLYFLPPFNSTVIVDYDHWEI